MMRGVTYAAVILSAVGLSTQQLQVRDSYDYIICGGGTAGLTLAGRLSELDATVLVVEVGGAEATATFWEYSQTLYNVTLSLWTGQGLGGSSATNGEIYIRAEERQIDDWERAGNPGWNWANLFPYYLKSEHFVPPNASQVYGGATYTPEYHGFDGPVHTGWSSTLNPSPAYLDILRQTSDNIGLPAIPDANGGSMRGTTTFPRTIEVVNGTDVRADSWSAYIEGAAEDRVNLDVLTETTALRIIWADQKGNENVTAAGVEIASVVTNGTSTPVVVKANKEVILSAGAYRSSSILEFSGVGNPSIMTPLGIDTVMDLPGVGEHLMDQPENILQWSQVAGTNFSSGATGYVSYPNATDFWGDETASVAADLLTALPDYAATIAAENNGAATAENVLQLLKIQYESIFEAEMTFTELLAQLALSTSAGVIEHQWWTTTPFSQGSVHINTNTPPTDGGIPVDIVNRFWHLDADVTLHVAAGRFLRKLYAAAPLNGSAVLEETSPGYDVVPLDATDDEWMEWLKTVYSTTWHPAGTTPMLPKEMGGVVSPELIVYGTSNVRVVDTGIFPFQVNGHPSATVYAVAERAADIIKASFTGASNSTMAATKRRGEGAGPVNLARVGVRGQMVQL